ncbi:hypothetical protein SAMN04488123_10790 [Natribacillus halophilus]|uniref:Uncharacterized protein n=1 Tax=Natribacillus halophilus TaxID=549003 RepID=A0A1G8NZU0_9BACI|nr:hypothetical protein SAMN04488123_10790 [Natribacillus halophilus]
MTLESRCHTPKAGYPAPRGTRSVLLYPKGRVSRSERAKNRVVIPQREGISLREGQEACCYTPKAGYLTPRGTRSVLLYPKGRVSRSERDKKHVAIPQKQGIPLREGQESRCYTPKGGHLTPRGTRIALLYPKGRASHSERDKKRVVIPQKQGISLREGQEACCHTPKAGHLTPRGTRSTLPYLKSRVSRSERDKKRVAIPQKQGTSLREGPTITLSSLERRGSNQSERAM